MNFDKLAALEEIREEISQALEQLLENWEYQGKDTEERCEGLFKAKHEIEKALNLYQVKLEAEE